MAKSETIKTTIDANINTNGNQAITGAVMNSVLKQMVDSTDAQLTELSEETKKNVDEVLGYIADRYDATIVDSGINEYGYTILPSYNASVLIPVKEGDIIRYTGYNNAPENSVIGYAEKGYVGAIQLITQAGEYEKYPILIPQGIKYVLFSGRADHPLYLEKYENLLTYIKESEKAKIEYIYIDGSINCFINESGSATLLDVACRYGYIPVKKGQVFIYSGKATDIVIGVAAYDEEYNYLYPIVAMRDNALIYREVCSNLEFEIPDGVSYIAVSTRDQSEYPLKLSRKLNLAEQAEQDACILLSYDVYNGICINTSTGDTYVLGNAQTTDYIPVTEGEYLIISSSFGYSSGLVGYDNNKEYVRAIANKTENESLYTFGVARDALIKIPNGVAYIRMSTIDSYQYPVVIKRVMGLQDVYKHIPFYQNNYQYAWFGDSISNSCSIPESVEKKMCCKVWNCSFAGAPLTYSDEIYQQLGFMNIANCIKNNDFSSLETAIQKLEQQGKDETSHRSSLENLKSINWEQITHAVIMAGTNDLSVSFATLSDIKNGFTQALQTFISDNPHISIYVVLPPYKRDISNAVNGLNQLDINATIKEVAESFNLPCLDFFHTCGVNEYNQAYYLDDLRLHPNEFGAAMWSTKLSNWLKSL